MIAAVLVMAAVGGAIPVTTSMERFPDARWWTGAGDMQVSNMLNDIARDGAGHFRTWAPGPQQLAARYLANGLDEQQRVAVLLGGAFFRDPALLPAYAAAARSEVLRERQAAAVGLAWLLGERPPPPGALVDRPGTWRRLGNAVEALVAATRTRTLVAIWADSYLEAVKQPRRPGLVLLREPMACLQAIRQLAQPEDVNEIIALWPQVADRDGRVMLMGVLEMITLQQFEPRPQGPRAPSGQFLVNSGLQQAESWVHWLCRSIDGRVLVRINVTNNIFDDGAGATTVVPWLRLLMTDLSFAWHVAAEAAVEFGAPAVSLTRSGMQTEANRQALGAVLEYFPVSREIPRDRRR